MSTLLKITTIIYRSNLFFFIVFRCRAKDKDQTGIRKEAFLDEGVTPLLLKLSLDQEGCYRNKNLIHAFNCSLRWICTVLKRFTDVIDEQNRYPYCRLEYDLLLKTFLSTVYLRASFLLNQINSKNVWEHGNLFAYAIYFNRFKCRLITFDD